MDERRVARALQAASELRTATAADYGQSINTEASERAAGSKYVYLDLARGFAALLVLAGHLRSFVFADLWTLGHVSVLWKAFYLITSLGQQSVMVFFVLSGFLITKNVSQLAKSGRWSWTVYAMKRLSRLWIVLLPALALTLVWDHLGIALTGSQLYTGALDRVFHSVPMSALSYTPVTAFGNIVFLQTILVPAFGSNGPLWSLANEFWYYVIFPLVFFALQRKITPIRRLIFALTAVVLCISLPKPLVILGLVWLMGYGVYRTLPIVRRMPKQSHMFILAFGLAALLACILLTKSNRLNGNLSDYSIGISFAIVLIALTQLHAPRWLGSAATFLSEFSYSLYLVHFPFLAFVFSFVFHNARFNPGPRGALIYAAAFIAACAYAFGVYWLFERNTATIQSVLSHRIQSKRLLRGESKATS